MYVYIYIYTCDEVYAEEKGLIVANFINTVPCVWKEREKGDV